MADPVYETLTSALGPGIAKPVELLFVIGFLASFLALQTSASRVIWSYARDGALPGSHVLGRLSRSARIPTAAILVTTVIGAGLFLLSNVATNIYTLMVNFTTGGFYLAFLFPLVGALVVQSRGQWRPGPFTLGRLSLPVTAVATVWACPGVPQHLLAAGGLPAAVPRLVGLDRRRRCSASSASRSSPRSARGSSTPASSTRRKRRTSARTLSGERGDRRPSRVSRHVPSRDPSRPSSPAEPAASGGRS